MIKRICCFIMALVMIVGIMMPAICQTLDFSNEIQVSEPAPTPAPTAEYHPTLTVYVEYPEHYEYGSTVTLVCHIEDAPPSYTIEWHQSANKNFNSYTTIGSGSLTCDVVVTEQNVNDYYRAQITY